MKLLITLVMLVCSISAMNVNNYYEIKEIEKKYKQKVRDKMNAQCEDDLDWKGHPIVRAASEEQLVENELGAYEFEGNGMNNATNVVGFEFQDYRLIDRIRLWWASFLNGANSSWYAPNSTHCFHNTLNLIQYDFDLLIIKYMYGTVKQNTLNSTLFLRNVSDVSYICLDTAENLYVYNMYKFKLFGNDWTNVLLGYLQNMLSNILTINKINNKIQLADDNNDTVTVYYHLGRIFTMLADFDPVILEDAGNPLEEKDFSYKLDSQDDDDEEIYFKPEIQKNNITNSIYGYKHPKVKFTVDETTTSGSSTGTTIKPNPAQIAADAAKAAEEAARKAREETNKITGIQGGADSYLLKLTSFDTIDWTFGLGEEIPGLKYLFTIQGPIEFTRGFINGTGMIKNNHTHACDDILANQFAPTFEKVVNVSETLGQMEDFYEIVYVIFDDLLLITNMVRMAYPVSYHCWNSAENGYNHFEDIIVFKNGYNPKSYLMNTVYNFGHMFDAIREVYFFFVQEQRGQINSVHDAGFSLGLFIYLLITPEIASYSTIAVEYTVKKDLDE